MKLKIAVRYPEMDVNHTFWKEAKIDKKLKIHHPLWKDAKLDKYGRMVRTFDISAFCNPEPVVGRDQDEVIACAKVLRYLTELQDRYRIDCGAKLTNKTPEANLNYIQFVNEINHIVHTIYTCTLCTSESYDEYAGIIRDLNEHFRTIKNLHPFAISVTVSK